MKVFMFFINVLYWLSIFLVPFGIFGFLALWLYSESQNNLILSIIITIGGIILGIILAELIRRKYGLDNFFGRRIATPDVDGSNILDNKSKN